MAPDLFSHWQGDKEALKRGEIRVFLTDEECHRVITRCLDYVQTLPGVSAANTALMGVCQSGRYPLVTLSQRTDIAAGVVFYGAAQDRDWGVNEQQPEPLEQLIPRLQAPFFCVFGEGDHVISMQDVVRLRNAFEAARKSYRMVVFPNVPHGFLNDTMPGRYRPQAAAAAWQMLLDFLDDVFVRGWPQQRVKWEFTSDISPDYDFSKNVRYE
ncbi:MAG: dienelactone hydrolase family protein [Alicyclobacillus sp.]|nr:dienelactone hydrolase family protein [Alicyclobacillus sp.]